MALMRAVPDMVCVEPTDATQMEGLLPAIIAHDGPVYIRMFRKKAEKVYGAGDKFELGKAYRLKEGADVTLLASGIMVARALAAAEILAEQGIDACVVNVCTWKPLDREEIVACASQTGAVVTCENHNIYGGLGSAIAELLVRECPVPMELVGINDKFGQVGKNAYLSEVYGITTNDIAEAAKRAVARKRKA